MNQEALTKLKSWRQKRADLEMCELYRVFQNKTLEAMATLLPKTKDELLAIKGIREKKFQKYGKDVLLIINECLGSESFVEVSSKEDKIYSVSSYLDDVNSRLSDTGARIKGEVSSFNLKGQLYFSLKDKNDGSVLDCFMWMNDYKMCGIEIEEGMELTIQGFSEIYKPNGRFTFRTSTIELVGEGALKKAYDELKKKLKDEGLFEDSRKKLIPDYPQSIGLITSRDGAVINDFLNNIGRFGYKITFVDSRVEGIMAVKDLISALKYFQKNPVDVLVIIRGGGSLESLQAFNNETLIREMLKIPVPVLCGIGHDKDIPLISFVADKTASTPTAVTQVLNNSWEKATYKIDYYLQNMYMHFREMMQIEKDKLEKATNQIKDFYSFIIGKFLQYEQSIKDFILNVGHTIRHEKYKVQKIEELIIDKFKDKLIQANNNLTSIEKNINQNSPERQLKLGYSIITVDGKVVRSVNQIKEGDVIIGKINDGEIESSVKKIINK
ncbi:MAG: exodeoxyribonuclease VII large subunit [uncultured bacterium]|nr:MAG: exodeoxyribonuclease VII large subunit [uncultured bacterium]HBR79839.1 exodeoxyribonuclease VII large subunit [Candidatus Moranbacteria bacterium]